MLLIIFGETYFFIGSMSMLLVLYFFASNEPNSNPRKFHQRLVRTINTEDTVKSVDSYQDEEICDGDDSLSITNVENKTVIKSVAMLDKGIRTR